MLTKAFSFGGLAGLAAAAALLTAQPGQAAPPRFVGGFGHFGGFHGGGFYGGFARYRMGYYGSYRFYRPYVGAYGPYYPYYGGYGGYPSYYGGYGPSGPDYIGPDYVWGSTPPAKPVLTAEEKDVRALLTAGGVPTDEGRPVWPLALRVVPGPEAEALRGQIDALLQTAATQAARGRPNPDVVQELTQATDQLRKLLVRHREERGGLAQTSYEDAERFLDKLGGARTLLRTQLAPAPAGPRGEGKGGSDAPDYRP